ncbi:MAG: GntR family transcriptional regulator [Rhizobiales bacterium]|nr:GntR family transcriptional regulator [Hyphomicrobiales bacterium]
MNNQGQLDYLRVHKDPTPLRERTAEALRSAIFNLHLKPGQRLVESELCTMTGVSRSSVREAMRNLEAEGLVRPMAGRGMQVTPLSADMGREIYEVRGVLEAAAGHNFAERATVDDVRDLKSAMSRLKKTKKSPAGSQYADALDDVYRVLLRGARNQVADQLIATLNGRIHLLQALASNAEKPKRRRKTITLVGEIVDAACQHKAKRTARLCKAFVDRSAVFAQKVLKKHAATLSAPTAEDA